LSQQNVADIPSPINLQNPEDASLWEKEAMQKRPWRTEFFEKFAEAIQQSNLKTPRILELGSGPGFLANYILEDAPHIDYTLLDFSEAMHSLAKKRLGKRSDCAKFLERSFRDENWTNDLGLFDFVITNQAVHELRHKRHAKVLHTQVLEVLAPRGAYLVCDHFVGDDGMTNDQLFMTINEQCTALKSAGFDVQTIFIKGGMALHKALASEQ
jgi:SAM-dependent methyltransferase